VIASIASISSLLTGTGVLLMGLGLLGTALGVRAAAEGFPDVVTGLVMTAYFAGFIVGTYICPGIVHRVGHIRAFAVFAAMAGVFAFAHAMVPHPLAWGILRLFTGMCLVGLYLVIESWLNSVTPNAQRGHVLAAYMTVTLIAMALGQYLLLIDPEAGIETFGIAGALFSLGLIPVAMTRLREPAAVGAPHLRLAHLLAVSPLGVCGALAAGMSTSAFWGMGAVFAHHMGLTGASLALFMSVTILGGIVLQWPIGRLSDHLDRRLVLLAAVFLSTVAALAIALAAVAGHSALYLFAFVFGGTVFSIYSLSMAHINDRLEAEYVMAASKGILLVFGIGAIFGPVSAGIFMHWLGPTGAFIYIAAVLGIFAVFGVIRIVLGSAVPEAERTLFLPMNRTSQAALELDPRSTEEHRLP
jgi:MFS family permease